MHIILTVPFALVASLCLFFSMKVNIFMTVAGTVFVLLFIVFYAAIGILLNLKYPKFDWTNHSVAVKQSMSVILSMLIAWAVMILLTVLYIFTGKHLGTEVFMTIAEVISLVLAGARFCQAPLFKNIERRMEIHAPSSSLLSAFKANNIIF